MKRSAILVGLVVALATVAFVLVGVAGSGPLRGLFHRGKGTISATAHGGVVRVNLFAIPEGPPAPAFERGPHHVLGSRPLSRIERFIPDPLPVPLDQNGCTMGGDLVITFADDEKITYGPCHRPASIDHLWAEMIYVLDPGCAPRCGPGGATGP